MTKHTEISADSVDHFYQPAGKPEGELCHQRSPAFEDGIADEAGQVSAGDTAKSAESQKQKADAHDTSVGQAHNRKRKFSVRDIDLSHDALALRMGREGFDEKARYVASAGKWFFWEGTHWQVDTKIEYLWHTREFLRLLANKLVKDAIKEAQGLDPVPANALQNWAKDQAKVLRSRSTINAVVTLAQANFSSAAQMGDFDRDPLLLGTPNGTVDLKNGDLMLARREHMITKMTACSPTKPNAQPILWLKFLHRIFDGDREMIEFMQRVAGYALTGLTTEHKFLFLHGSGRNGKSVLLNTLQWIMGDYARTASSDLLMASGQGKHKTEVAGLQGMRLVVASEIPKYATWNEARIKELTGGDTISANFMHQDLFDFKPQLTLLIAANDKPRLHDVSTAMRSRMQLVPFNVQIPAEEQDRDLEEKLKQEGPEILRWAIDGALAWQQRGLDIPDTIKKASMAYLDDEDWTCHGIVPLL